MKGIAQLVQIKSANCQRKTRRKKRIKARESEREMERERPGRDSQAGLLLAETHRLAAGQLPGEASEMGYTSEVANSEQDFDPTLESSF